MAAVGFIPAQRKAALAHFGLVVKRLREQAGFPSARAVYESCGGRAFFGCTYKAYANLEAGLSAPAPRLVERLVAVLRLPHNLDRAGDFAEAYLRVLLGSDEFARLAARALGGTAPGGRYEPLPVKDLTPAQAALLERDADAFGILAVLANDAASWSVESLAAALARPAAALRRSLAALGREGLVARRGEGWRCPWAGKALLPAESAPEAARGRGESLVEHPLLLRASQAELSHYFRTLAGSLQTAGLCASAAPAPDSHLYFLEVSVLKLL